MVKHRSISVLLGFGFAYNNLIQQYILLKTRRSESHTSNLTLIGFLPNRSLTLMLVLFPRLFGASPGNFRNKQDHKGSLQGSKLTSK